MDSGTAFFILSSNEIPENNVEIQMF
jgi:hypothetical protein